MIALSKNPARLSGETLHCKDRLLLGGWRTDNIRRVGQLT